MPTVSGLGRVACGAAERGVQHILPIGRVGSLGTGQTHWHSFGGSTSADCASSLGRYREYPVAHLPNDADADSRYRPDPNFPHLVHSALRTKCYRHAVTIRCCIGWSVPVGNLSCLSICWRSPWIPRLYAWFNRRTGVGSLPRDRTNGCPLHPARSRGCLLGSSVLPHDR